MLKMIKVADSTQAASSHSIIGPDLISIEVSFQVKFSNSPSEESHFLDKNSLAAFGMIYSPSDDGHMLEMTSHNFK